MQSTGWISATHPVATSPPDCRAKRHSGAFTCGGLTARYRRAVLRLPNYGRRCRLLPGPGDWAAAGRSHGCLSALTALFCRCGPTCSVGCPGSRATPGTGRGAHRKAAPPIDRERRLCRLASVRRLALDQHLEGSQDDLLATPADVALLRNNLAGVRAALVLAAAHRQ